MGNKQEQPKKENPSNEKQLLTSQNTISSSQTSQTNLEKPAFKQSQSMQEIKPALVQQQSIVSSGDPELDAAQRQVQAAFDDLMISLDELDKDIDKMITDLKKEQEAQTA